jgi:hypothetical protein
MLESLLFRPTKSGADQGSGSGEGRKEILGERESHGENIPFDINNSEIASLLALAQKMDEDRMNQKMRLKREKTNERLKGGRKLANEELDGKKPKEFNIGRTQTLEVVDEKAAVSDTSSSKTQSENFSFGSSSFASNHVMPPPVTSSRSFIQTSSFSSSSPPSTPTAGFSMLSSGSFSHEQFDQNVPTSQAPAPIITSSTQLSPPSVLSHTTPSKLPTSSSEALQTSPALNLNDGLLKSQLYSSVAPTSSSCSVPPSPVFSTLHRPHSNIKTVGYNISSSLSSSLSPPPAPLPVDSASPAVVEHPLLYISPSPRFPSVLPFSPKGHSNRASLVSPQLSSSLSRSASDSISPPPSPLSTALSSSSSSSIRNPSVEQTSLSSSSLSPSLSRISASGNFSLYRTPSLSRMTVGFPSVPSPFILESPVLTSYSLSQSETYSISSSSGGLTNLSLPFQFGSTSDFHGSPNIVSSSLSTSSFCSPSFSSPFFSSPSFSSPSFSSSSSSSSSTSSSSNPNPVQEIVNLKLFLFSFLLRRMHFEHPFSIHLPLHRFLSIIIHRIMLLDSCTSTSDSFVSLSPSPPTQPSPSSLPSNPHSTVPDSGLLLPDDALLIMQQPLSIRLAFIQSSLGLWSRY